MSIAPRASASARVISPGKLIVGIGSYGYDWAGKGNAQEIWVQEAWELLEASGATLSFDKASLNPTFTYVDDIEHWFTRQAKRLRHHPHHPVKDTETAAE